MNNQFKNKIYALLFFLGILSTSIGIYFSNNKAITVLDTVFLCVAVKFFFDIMSDNKNV
jgi:hypothetical protein